MLDAGLWTLESGLWTLHSEPWTLDSGIRTLNARLWTLKLLNLKLWKQWIYINDFILEFYIDKNLWSFQV